MDVKEEEGVVCMRVCGDCVCWVFDEGWVVVVVVVVVVLRGCGCWKEGGVSGISLPSTSPVETEREGRKWES